MLDRSEQRSLEKEENLTLVCNTPTVHMSVVKSSSNEETSKAKKINKRKTKQQKFNQ